MKKDIYAEFINIIFNGSEEDKEYQQELLDKLQTVEEGNLR